MKVYYAENDLFPATHNFKDEVDDASGTDIDFIDSTAGTDSGTSATIISLEDGHRKVIKFLANGDNGAHFRWKHILDSDQTIGTIELQMKYIDKGVGNHRFDCYDASSFLLFYLEFNSLDNKLYVFHGDGIGGTTSTSVAAIADIWHHIKIVFNTTTDVVSVDLNDVNVITDETYRNDHDGDNLHELQFLALGGAGANSLEGYVDAIGYSWDTDYNVGENRFVDMHDPYNKEQITDIVIYPTITPILDKYYIGNITIRDFEGALFSSWHGRDFNKILIEDNSDNVLFRGFLIGKQFTTDSLILTIAGIGILLDWQPFGNEGYVDYIKAYGLVNAPISNDSIIQLQTDALAVFTWDVDWWIEGGKDLGLLIVDKTDVNKRTWDSSAITLIAGTNNGGNNASTLTYNDGDYYSVRTSGAGLPRLNYKHTIDGIVIDSAAPSFLKSIEIQYNFRVGMTGGDGPYYSYATIYLQILKDTKWETLAQIPIERAPGFTYWTPWLSGIPITTEGGNGNQKIIEGTDTELQKYFNKTGDDYDELKGLCFRAIGGSMDGAGWVEVNVDFINVKVGYMSDDIGPIMETITENSATAITCDGVSAWDETGVVDVDGFKIGVNTRTVIQDIGNHSGLYIIGGTTGVETLTPNADIATPWNFSTQVNHYESIDLDDADIVQAQAVDDAETEEIGFTTFTLTDIDAIAYVSKLVLTIKAKDSGDSKAFGAGLYFDGAYQSGISVTLTGVYKYYTHTYNNINLDQTELTALKVRLVSDIMGIGETISVSFVSVVATWTIGSVFSKYMARKFKGKYCIEPLKAVCELEGAHWYEDYINNRIVVLKLADFVDSTVDLTEADYEHDWKYEDECNQVKSFLVFGKSDDEIFAKAVDESVEGYISKQLIDETISNVADAQEIADVQLALLKTKKPSIRLPLKEDNVLLQLGTTVHVTLARPTVAQVLYPIRRIERSKFGASIKTVIYCGMGESPIGEKIAKHIRDNAFRSHKSLTDRLISP